MAAAVVMGFLKIRSHLEKGRLLDLRGQLAEASILAGGLLVHAGLGGGDGERRLLVDEHEEATDLLIGNHSGWGLAEEGSARQRGG